MPVLACASARNIQCKHIDAEVNYWVDLGPMMLPGETVTGTPVATSEDPNLVIGAVTIVTPEQIIYSDEDCDVVLTTIGADRGVYFMLSEGTVGMQTIKLVFDKSTGETDVINLLLRVVD